ncbi:MAG: M50 family metallopeptidase [Spirochaetales bacterium]|nr:M50 family metallopeptidase [Spirochaetales bacterium]
MTLLRRRWLVRNGLTFAVFLLLWNTVPVRPLRVLVVLLHEISHALAVLLTGGGVHTIEVISHRSGMISLSGGMAIPVYSAGYLGTALIGSLLIGSSHHYPLKRSLYLGLGLLVLVNTLVFVRNPFGWAYGLLAGLFLVTLFFREFWFSPYITDLIGVLCLVDVFRDLVGFAFRRSRNDAAILSELTGLPYAGILAAWAAVCLLMVGVAGSVVWKNLDPDRLDKRLEWGEFRFATRRFVERSAAVKSEPEEERKRSKLTLAAYLSVIGALVLLLIWASRFVLFQPWTARDWVTAAAVNSGEVYVFGGRDRAAQNYDEVYEIDVERLRIHEVSTLPSPRFGMGAAAFDQKICLLGGYDGRRVYDDILVFDAVKMAAVRVGGLPGPRTFGAAVGATGGTGAGVFYLGGWDGTRHRDEILRIDPASGRSAVIGRLPSPRELIAAAWYEDRIYVLGGADERGSYLDEIVEIDPEDGRTLRVGHLPSSRTRASAVESGGRLYLIGGWEGRRVDEVVEVIPAAEAITCRVVARLPRGFSDFGAASQGGVVYLIGGTHERFRRQIGVLGWDPDTGAVESLKFRSFLFW